MENLAGATVPPPGNPDNPFEQTSAALTNTATSFIFDTDRTIEASVDYLVRVYSLIKSLGLDVNAFINNYTWRPVATLTEILGTNDLILTKTDEGDYKATRGKEGFHSRAYSSKSDLFGLVNPEVQSILGLSNETMKDRAAAERMDVRGRRYEAVRNYLDKLSSRGMLG
jgi:hypothetical protein